MKPFKMLLTVIIPLIAGFVIFNFVSNTPQNIRWHKYFQPISKNKCYFVVVYNSKNPKFEKEFNTLLSNVRLSQILSEYYFPVKIDIQNPVLTDDMPDLTPAIYSLAYNNSPFVVLVYDNEKNLVTPLTANLSPNYFNKVLNFIVVRDKYQNFFNYLLANS
ncbi:MAG TPA: hypothetical protein PLI27_04175 [Ignavibacteriales bacterium]|nr:hypothetical protein [Ignavibacteriales bacterium]HOL81892.1 hypothetical protein [Ignavibacteriales bacterium]HOM65007.1 hypothetical protein [Ignavibacteriales bacterium]HPD67261.1 hypothetical protein [Ignavibacteriales bacterium]HPP33971.1 hypothetical protein [Ignavibacteriales bacterium]